LARGVLTNTSHGMLAFSWKIRVFIP
jgi:hypothetical protein